MSTRTKQIPQLPPAKEISGVDMFVFSQNNIAKRVNFETIQKKILLEAGTAKDVEFRKSGGYIQWKYVGTPTWINLVSLEDITGPSGGLSSRPTTYFTGNGSRLVFSPVPGLINTDATKCIVVVGGITQLANSSYTVNLDSGGSLVFDEAPPALSISVQIFQ